MTLLRQAALSLFLLLLLLTAAVPAEAQDGLQITNQAAYSYADGHGGEPLRGLTVRSQIVDPRGVVLGDGGVPLPSLQGFRVAIYLPDPADPTGAEVKAMLPLIPTGAADGAGLPLGFGPNTSNVNPFPLSDAEGGRFVFLLDSRSGQLDAGRTYILVLSPPPGSAYGERRVRIVIGAQDASTLTYTATSLDGGPVSTAAGQRSAVHTVLLQAGGLAALSLTLTVSLAHPVQITKTGDRAAAEPGDTVVYRIAVQNTTGLPLGHVQVQDTLPAGFDLREDSVRAAAGGKAVPVTVTRSGRDAVFSAGTLLVPPGQALTLVYGAQLTPDALRGDGKNSASVTADAQATFQGDTTNLPVTDGPAVYQVQVRQGILTDTGTVIGRVWIDRNRDGEQQRGEPGLPGAVVILDDSTRIVADANGLFSVPTVSAGWHAAALDMQSVPGYTLARSRFRERRSQSRLVRLSPGGLVRLNFAVVPTDLPAGGAK